MAKHSYSLDTVNITAKRGEKTNNKDGATIREFQRETHYNNVVWGSLRISNKNLFDIQFFLI